MKNSLGKIVFPVFLLAFSVDVNSATIVAESDFSAGLEGWGGNATWVSSGGNPGGYARFVQQGPAPTDITAPLSFLGNWSELNNVGTISFDHALFDVGPGNKVYYPYSVAISGSGNSATWTGQTPGAATDWVHLNVPLIENQWVVESGSWSQLLENVESFNIRIELVANSFGADSAGIDNVALSAVPLPAAGWLFVSAIAGFSVLGRKRATRKE